MYIFALTTLLVGDEVAISISDLENLISLCTYFAAKIYQDILDYVNQNSKSKFWFRNRCLVYLYLCANYFAKLSTNSFHDMNAIGTDLRVCQGPFWVIKNLLKTKKDYVFDFLLEASMGNF